MACAVLASPIGKQVFQITATLREPLILGHEMAGVVDQLGAGITTVAAGDRVTFDPATLVGDYGGKPRAGTPEQFMAQFAISARRLSST